jgi:hypothetical protein
MMPPEQPEPRRRQEGNVIHLETQMRARLQAMVAWEARRTAREEVKRKLKARAEITRLANAHLRTHAAELLGKAEASGAVQNLRVAHRASGLDAQGLSACTPPVQNGEPK